MNDGAAVQVVACCRFVAGLSVVAVLMQGLLNNS